MRGDGRTNAAHARGWIARGRDDAARLLRGLDHRHEQRLRTHVEQLLDHRDVRIDRPDHHMRRIGRERLELAQDGAHIVGRVLAVDQQPAEARGRGDFGGVIVGEREPQTDLRFASGQRPLESVDGHRDPGEVVSFAYKC